MLTEQEVEANFSRVENICSSEGFQGCFTLKDPSLFFVMIILELFVNFGELYKHPGLL